VPFRRAWRTPQLATFCARVRCAGLEPRSAFLKEWGRVKVFVLVALSSLVRAGALKLGRNVVVLSGSAPGFVDLRWAGSAAGHSFADRWQRGAFRPRPDGLKQLVDRAAGCGGHADCERASGRVRAVHAACARHRISPSRKP
jgi:hypothetical protein